MEDTILIDTTLTMLILEIEEYRWRLQKEYQFGRFSQAPSGPTIRSIYGPFSQSSRMITHYSPPTITFSVAGTDLSFSRTKEPNADVLLGLL
jgi:hypothetical protein